MTTQTTIQSTPDTETVLSVTRKHIRNGTPQDHTAPMDAYIGTCSANSADVLAPLLPLGTVFEYRTDGKLDVWNGALLDALTLESIRENAALTSYDVSARDIQCDHCGARADVLSDYSGIAACGSCSALTTECAAWSL